LLRKLNGHRKVGKGGENGVIANKTRKTQTCFREAPEGTGPCEYWRRHQTASQKSHIRGRAAGGGGNSLTVAKTTKEGNPRRPPQRQQRACTSRSYSRSGRHEASGGHRSCSPCAPFSGWVPAAAQTMRTLRCPCGAGVRLRLGRHPCRSPRLP